MTIQNEDVATSPAAANPAAAAASATQAKAADATSGGDDGGSLLDGVTSDGAAKPDAPKPLAERIPDKYRVTGADGKLDEAASMAKVLDGYEHLSKKLGSGADGPPATPADYKLELLAEDGKPRDDIDLAQFTADPMFQGFAKGAHEQGITNAQLNWIVGRYLDVAPQLVAADAELSKEEAKAELGKLWSDESSFKGGIQSAMRAMKGYGGEAENMPGSHARLMAKYGRDPDFLAFAAAIGREMQEDRPASGDAVGGVGEGDIEALMRGEAYRNPNHPDHARTKQKVGEYFDRKYGAKKR